MCAQKLGNWCHSNNPRYFTFFYLTDNIWDYGLKRNNGQTPPCAVIGGADTGQMIRE